MSGDVGLGYGKRKLLQAIIQTHWDIENPELKQYTYNELLFIIQEMLDQEGKAYMEDTNRRPAFYIFKEFVQYLLYRNLSNYDSMILITSEKGTGKSSAAIMMAREWCRLIGIKFSPKRHIAYNNADVMNKIDLLNKFEVIIADEAVRFASSEDWAKRENKDLKKRLAQIRTKHLLFILCFPLKINKLEKNYLESFVNYWCLTGDTTVKVLDFKGMIRDTPIKEIHKRHIKVLSFNEKENKYEFKDFDKKIKTKKNAEIFEIELINGQKIKATEDHPFLTQRGWIKLKDLTENDEIEVYSKKCKYCKKEFVPKRNSMNFCCVKCNNAFNVRTPRQFLYNKKYRKDNNKKLKILQKNNYIKNKNKILKEAKLYREKNKDRINKWAEEYRKNNIELLRKRDKEYRENNYDKYINRSRKKYYKYMKENINFKLAHNLRSGLRRALQRLNAKKTYSVFKYLGCSLEYFKEYIFKQFKPGMTWKNWTKDTWHLDHKRPCASFDLRNEAERYICFNYKNLQPLWAVENLSKSDKYEN
jgi:hypothetical protein